MINKNMLLFSLFFWWTDGATVIFFPSRFPTFWLDFLKIVFHTNLFLPIMNTTKKDSAKSVKPFQSLSRTKKSDFILYYMLMMIDD